MENSVGYELEYFTDQEVVLDPNAGSRFSIYVAGTICRQNEECRGTDQNFTRHYVESLLWITASLL